MDFLFFLFGMIGMFGGGKFIEGWIVGITVVVVHTNTLLLGRMGREGGYGMVR